MRRWIFAGLLSVAVHGGLFASLRRSPGQLLPPAAPREMSMEVQTVYVAPAAVAALQAPPSGAKRPTTPAPPPRQTPILHRRSAAAVPAVAAARAAPILAPAAEPRRIGLSLSSTTSSGNLPMAVGGAQGDKADAPAEQPDSTSGNANAQQVPSYALSEAPAVETEPDLQAYYPEAARQQNVEGQVSLELSLNAQGKVIEAKILQSGGSDFDKAALRAAQEKLRFKPARWRGQAVGTQIVYKMTFLLD